MTAAEIIAEAQRSGIDLARNGDKLRYHGPAESLAKIKPLLAQHKPAIIAELRRRSHAAQPAGSDPSLSAGSKFCCGCKRLDRCYPLDDGRYVCPACLEWRVDCERFTIARSNLGENVERAACIRCGAALAMHDSPPPEAWVIVEDDALDEVEIAAARFVLAVAQGIARGNA